MVLSGILYVCGSQKLEIPSSTAKPSARNRVQSADQVKLQQMMVMLSEVGDYHKTIRFLQSETVHATFPGMASGNVFKSIIYRRIGTGAIHSFTQFSPSYNILTIQ